MSDFQIVIAGGGKSPPKEDASDLGVRLQSKNDVVERIEDMEGMWPEVMAKLSAIAEKSEPADKSSGLVLDTIEFNIGIEAGLNFGLVSKGTAAVSISFARKA